MLFFCLFFSSSSSSSSSSSTTDLGIPDGAVTSFSSSSSSSFLSSSSSSSSSSTTDFGIPDGAVTSFSSSCSFSSFFLPQFSLLFLLLPTSFTRKPPFARKQKYTTTLSEKKTFVAPAFAMTLTIFYRRFIRFWCIFSSDKNLLPIPSDTDIVPLPPTTFTYEAPRVPGVFESPVYFGEIERRRNIYRRNPQGYQRACGRSFTEPVSRAPIGGPGVPAKQNYVPPEPDTWVSYAYIQSQRGNGNQQATPEYQARQTPPQQQLDQACAKPIN